MRAKCGRCGVSVHYKAKFCHKCATIGSRNPFYGKTHTSAVKAKLKLFPKGHVPFIKGRRHTIEARIKNSIAHQEGNVKTLNFGKNLRNAVRHSGKYIEWRQSVFIRDQFTCQNERCHQRGGRLEVHHTTSFGKLVQEAMEYMPLLTPYDACMMYAPLWDSGVGQTLCVKCHRRKEGDFVCKEK